MAFGGRPGNARRGGLHRLGLTLVIEGGQIQQEGVFAQQTATGPTRLHQEVHVGLPHRLLRGHPHNWAFGMVQQQFELKLTVERHALKAGTLKIFLGSQPDDNLVATQPSQVGQLDVRLEGLIERRLQLGLPKPQGKSRLSNQQGGQSDYKTQLTKQMHRTILYYLPGPMCPTEVIDSPVDFDGTVNLFWLSRSYKT